LKVLVTGGAGYIGQSLINDLQQLEEVKEVKVLDNLKTSCHNFFIGTHKLTKAKFIKGDILNYDLLHKLVEDVDAIFHLAGTTSHAYTYAQNIQYEQINQWGTLNLVRAIQDNSKNLKKIYYLSSMSVFGLRPNVDISNSIAQPTNAYGKSKLEGEKYMSLLKNDFEVGIIRSANVFGFNQGFRNDSVLNNFIFNGIVYNKILIYGDGTQFRPFVSLEKLVEVLCNLLKQQLKLGLSFKHIVDFNATMNDIKDELLKYLPDLEYTYLNTNLKYDGQSIEGIPQLEEKQSLFEEAYENFNANIRF
jgi:UDP-glucose 4-epimerase